MRKMFQGEEIRLGHPQLWLGHSWDLRLASVGNIIYKVAIEAHASDRSDAEDLSTLVLSKLQQEFGNPSQPNDAIFLWGAADGNVVLQFANVGGDRRLILFLTSKIAGTFTPYKDNMKKIIAFIVAGISAYSYSFAFDLLLGALLKVYPSTAFLPVVTWLVIATITVFIALRLMPTGRFLIIPFLIFALLSLIGGVVGHRYSLIVSLAIFIESAGIWFATGKSISK
jgi:hypothetical protein